MHIFEALMLVCFGAAWPVSIRKSIVSRRTGGKSVGFMFIIFAGYLSGIANKLLNAPGDPVLWLYVLNGVMVATDIALYFRNRRIERTEERRG